MRTNQFTARESAPQGLVAFKARILAAVPGKSLNGRIYTKQLLQQTAPLYVSKGFNTTPFILDHDIEHVERVTGLITGARYDVENAMDGTPIEGLWLDAMGYMDEKLFAKMQGSKTIPPFVRGVSIGGEGEGDFVGNGVLLTKFIPAELSMTAFPGIPPAHVADLERIRESYAKRPVQSYEVKDTTKIQIQEKDVSLEDAEKQARQEERNPRKIREAQLPPPDKGTNDSRPGLPTPTVRTKVTHVQPQATTSADSGFRLNPQDSTASSRKQMLAVGSKSNSIEEAPGTTGAPGSKDAKPFKPKIPKTGATTTTHPGFGNLSPSGTGMDSKDEEETEEAVQDLGDQTQPVTRKTDKKGSANPSIGKPGANPNAPSTQQDEDEEEESEEEESEEAEEHGPSPHIPGKPVGKKSPHAADNAYDSPADQGEEEEESEAMTIKQDDEPVGVTKGQKPGTGDEEDEEDGVTVDPIRKVAGQGQNLNANPSREENGPKVLFSEAEAVQARAFSLPTNAGILATLSQLASPGRAKEALNTGNVEELVKELTRPDHTISREQVAQLLEKWNRGKAPKPAKPQKIVIRKPGIGSSKDVSIPDARRTPDVTEGVVKTRSVTSIAPAMGASSVSTIPDSRLQEILEEEKKRPYSNVSYLNVAKRTWNRAVQDLMEFR